MGVTWSKPGKLSRLAQPTLKLNPYQRRRRALNHLPQISALMNHLLDSKRGERMTTPLLETLPEPTAEQMEEIRQEHESFLSDLEVAAVKALGTGNWDDVESCLFFYNPETDR